VNGGKYKPVAKKVRPQNEPMPQDLNPLLRPIEWDRDPLSRVSPRFTPSEKITTERIEGLNFGTEGWLSEEEFPLLADVVKLREKVLAFDRKKGDY
jgi:hypothetical protein